ncbi:MAG TPA: hypothetical protein VFZ42_10560 [Chitinophagaceae bacterium]
MATKESVTGITEDLQKSEVIPESIGLVITKAQAGVKTNLVLSSFMAYPGAISRSDRCVVAAFNRRAKVQRTPREIHMRIGNQPVHLVER